MSQFKKLWHELETLRAMLEEAQRQTPELTREVHAELRSAAANLIDYVALRQIDLRPLQFELERRGLSSLGRMEGHVRDALFQVRARVWDALRCEGNGGLGDSGPPPMVDVGITAQASEQVLHKHTQALLGPRPHDRHIYIMVTAPSAAEVNVGWVARLLDAGMNVLRVNGAHEGPTEWQHIVETARRVAASRSVPLRVLVDLPGPKLRTVAARPGVRVVRWKPNRDVCGRVLRPCQVAVHSGDATQASETSPSLYVPQAVFMTLLPGDELVFRDARGRSRRLAVAVLPSGSTIGNLRRTAYVVPGTRVEQRRAGEKVAEFVVGEIPERPAVLRLSTGDRLRLETPPFDADTLADELPLIGCSLPEAVAALEPGARVIFDDGKIDCVTEKRYGKGVWLRVTRAPEGGAKLAAEKGIYLPVTSLPGFDLTAGDEAALAFAVAHADMVGLSFIKGRESVLALYERLAEVKKDLGVVLKIETAAAFADLPSILLTAMTRYPLGVMIARGDLAIEVGFQRLAEVQEELLWLCEAAQLPVIWATEVLAHLAREGVATRAEVTDAAMSVRAECVMLNKGPQIEAAALALVDILGRMEEHQYKKRSLHRKLSLRLPSPPR
jgi:pyruvate kinase